MNNIKILHCADLHIGRSESFLGTSAPARRVETLLTFEKIITEAAERSIDIILIAGDLLDSNNIEKSLIDRIIDSISAVPQITVVYAAGNHDPYNDNSPFMGMTLPQNLYILAAEDDCITFEKLKTRVYGRSFKEVYMQGTAQFSLKPESDGFINLMCIHGELRSDLNSDYNSITASFIENSGMDYIALGHIHKRTPIGKIGNTHFAYCGCSEGQGFDELDEKGVYIGEVSSNRCQLEFVKLCRRMHLKEAVDVSECMTSPDVTEKILSILKEKYTEFSDHLYKIILTGAVDENARFSCEEIAGRLNEFVYFAKLQDNTEIKLDLQSLADENTLKGIFIKTMLQRIDAAQDDDQRHLMQYALNIGLKAFGSEVRCNED